MAESSLEKLQDIIGHRFKTPQLLLEALTHSSFARETSERVRDNEQLEFLGDAVMNFLVSVRLAEIFPEDKEGELSRGRARLVGADHLSRVAARLNLGEYLRLGKGEEKTGGRSKSTLLVNALEALVASLYRDGGLEAARHFVEDFVLPPGLKASAGELFSVDYKSALQEFLQGERLGPAEYRVVEERGPEHQKTFTVEVRAGEDWVARGRGSSKKSAEVQAARGLLERLGKRAEIRG